MTNPTPPSTPEPAGSDPRQPRPAKPQVEIETLVAWIDGELPAAEAARVAAAVAADPALQREADLLRRSGDLVARLPRRAATEGFADRVIAAARRGTPGSGEGVQPIPRSGTRLGRLLSLPRMRIAVAAAVVAAVAGTMLLRDPRNEYGFRKSEEDAIAQDLLILANLEALESADAEDLSRIADDLDVIDQVADVSELGG